VSQKIGLAKLGKGLGIAFADYDRDGYTDIFVANESTLEFLYHNKGNGTFEEVALINNAAVDGDGRTFAGMGVDFADYNNDGLPDVVVTDLANQMYALYQNNGDGSFDYATLTQGWARSPVHILAGALRFLDYDNDGWKDLLIAQGHDLDTIQLTSPNLRYREPMLLARNTGQGTCRRIREFRERSSSKRGRLAAWQSATSTTTDDWKCSCNNQRWARLYSSQTRRPPQNHWLTLRLVGHKSNRDGNRCRSESSRPKCTRCRSRISSFRRW